MKHGRIVRFVISVLICFFVLAVQAQETATSLSLDEAIRLALAQNINLQAARDRVNSADIALERARSEFGIKIRPEVSGFFQQGEDLNQSYSVRISRKFPIGGELSGQAKSRIDDAVEENRYQTDVTISYTQPLLKGRGTLATTTELVSAERNIQSQYRALLMAQQQLMINVATAYYGIVRDQMLVEVNLRALERANTLLRAAEAKLKVGMASKMDVFRAELQVLTAENGLVDARESLENTKRHFNLLLGVELGAEFVLSTPLKYEPVEFDQELLVQQAMEQRLELQDAYEDVNDAERRLKIARQNLYPPLDLSIRYTLSGDGDAFDKSWNLDEDRWGMGVSSSFDFNVASDQATYQQAQLAYNGAIRALLTTEQDILLDVLQTMTSVRQAEARVYLQEQSVSQSEKQLELAEIRYKKGLSDNLDVIDAEEALMKARTSYYGAVVQHLIAKLKLKQATGALEIPF